MSTGYSTLGVDVCSAAESRQFPSKPLRESQSRLLSSTPSWTESDGAADKDKKGLCAHSGRSEKWLRMKTHTYICWNVWICRCRQPRDDHRTWGITTELVQKRRLLHSETLHTSGYEVRTCCCASSCRSLLDICSFPMLHPASERFTDWAQQRHHHVAVSCCTQITWESEPELCLWAALATYRSDVNNLKAYRRC